MLVMYRCKRMETVAAHEESLGRVKTLRIRLINKSISGLRSQVSGPSKTNKTTAKVYGQETTRLQYSYPHCHTVILQYSSAPPEMNQSSSQLSLAHCTQLHCTHASSINSSGIVCTYETTTHNALLVALWRSRYVCVASTTHAPPPNYFSSMTSGTTSPHGEECHEHCFTRHPFKESPILAVVEKTNREIQKALVSSLALRLRLTSLLLHPT